MICHIINSKLVVSGPRSLADLVSMEYYGPRYKLEVLANNADDHNPPEYLEKIK
jgi:hypothetical protein